MTALVELVIDVAVGGALVLLVATGVRGLYRLVRKAGRQAK